MFYSFRRTQIRAWRQKRQEYGAMPFLGQSKHSPRLRNSFGHGGICLLTLLGPIFRLVFRVQRANQGKAGSDFIKWDVSAIFSE